MAYTSRQREHAVLGVGQPITHLDCSCCSCCLSVPASASALPALISAATRASTSAAELPPPPPAAPPPAAMGAACAAAAEAAALGSPDSLQGMA